MTAKQMWNKFKTMSHIADNAYDSWAFGDEPDMLASLVLQGKKNATASVYELYELDGEEYYGDELMNMGVTLGRLNPNGMTIGQDFVSYVEVLEVK